MRLRLSVWFVAAVFLSSLGCSDDTVATTDSGLAPLDASSTDEPDAKTDEPTTGPPVCVEHCEGGGTCSPGSVCDGSRCIVPSNLTTCTTANDCIPASSFWASGSSCTTADGCSSIEECVDVGGQGYCNRKPTESNPNVCANRGKVDVVWPNIEGVNVTVCGIASAVCEGDVCIAACESHSDCTRSSLPVCNFETSRCGCGPTSCSSIKGSACLPSGDCGCVQDGDCDRVGFDHCYDGVCGCADSETCDGIIGKALICEALP